METQDSCNAGRNSEHAPQWGVPIIPVRASPVKKENRNVAVARGEMA